MSLFDTGASLLSLRNIFATIKQWHDELPGHEAVTWFLILVENQLVTEWQWLPMERGDEQSHNCFSKEKNKRNWYEYTVNWHQLEALVCHLTFHCLLQFRSAALADWARCLEMYHPPSPQTDQVTTAPKIYITRRVGTEKLQPSPNSPLLRRKTMI